MKNDPKVLRGWTLYDWANSAYMLTITTSIFPLYYQAATRGAFGGDTVDFFGIQLDNDSLYSYTLSASFLVIALISPILSGIADYSGRKKDFMKFFVYLGSGACIGMAFFEGGNIEYGMLCSFLASIGYAGSIVFYNAYLPEIATRDQHDHLSARGYAMGYIGSVLLLIVNLIPILNPHWFYDLDGKVSELMAAQAHMGEAEALQSAKGYFSGISCRIAFVTVGIWWIGFSHISFRLLPDGMASKKMKAGENLIAMGYKELGKVWGELKQIRSAKTYLISYLFFNAGVMTIMYLAVIFAQDQDEIKLGFTDAQLIMITLIIQVVAIGGAYLFSIASKRYGNTVSLSIMILIWIGVCVAAYLLDQQWHFYAVAGVVGLIMGGVQSTARATYSKLLPVDTKDPTSFFSFYDVVEKSSTVLGTLAFGLAKDMTGSLRTSALVLGIFFVIGLILLQYAKIPSASQINAKHVK